MSDTKTCAGCPSAGDCKNACAGDCAACRTGGESAGCGGCCGEAPDLYEISELVFSSDMLEEEETNE